MRCATWTRFDRLLLFISIKNKVTSAAITGLGIAVEKGREWERERERGGRLGVQCVKVFKSQRQTLFISKSLESCKSLRAGREYKQSLGKFLPLTVTVTDRPQRWPSIVQVYS